MNNNIYGFIQLPWWGYIVIALVFTHITIMSVTLFLHRCQAHRSVMFHPVLAHFFRFWLWLTTGMVTREWVAVHRKHHAFSERPGDPHSPMLFGLHKVLWGGVFLYKKAAQDSEVLKKYGHNTPSDWLENHLYTPYNSLGIVFMLVINLACFGVVGFAIWLVQMVWIPFFAAGVINGLGHYFGYRNFQCDDTSTNLIPFGILIGGEELHNNHHAYGSSAKFSVQWWEFDIGWFYIKLFSLLGLATVRKQLPKVLLSAGKSRDEASKETLIAVFNHRFLILNDYYKKVLLAIYKQEIKPILKIKPKKLKLLKRDNYYLDHCDRYGGEKKLIQLLLNSNDNLKIAYEFKLKLQELWTQNNKTQHQLIQELQRWCQQAESESAPQVLHQFSRYLRRYRVVA
ncbi:DesA family fatty acid desaturase [Piscirickettsia salmonis]|uniref:DesA family fatty acid desaturase n=1 Tax=Piscirickettsia salmonis TaxID=1238 RepID=UPI0007C97D71|nr:Fatty acid desaturase [Piscirickettsiaceae bacterium NZ-RLO1]